MNNLVILLCILVLRLILKELPEFYVTHVLVVFLEDPFTFDVHFGIDSKLLYNMNGKYLIEMDWIN